MTIEAKADFSDYGEDEERLVIDLFRDYNSLIRPVQNISSPPVTVDFGVAMILLINVDEKNQILQTNVWLTMKWNDFQLRWNPVDYGNITNLHVPSDRVWLPDIVLFNNADGNYEVSFRSNAFVEANGDVTWVPPAMFKSSCRIDVEWFPFDEQSCTLVFGSWTYNLDEVVLNWYNNIQAVQLTDYSFSGIWDVIDVPGYLINKKETKESKIVFHVVIRRKTLFYTVILIIPTVLMAFLSMMAFYLPADSAEKISLTINLLLALVVFLLLVSKILPPTSNIPLMGKYLLLAFVLNITTVVVTVVIVNVYFRSALSHEMPDYVRRIFLDFLPRVLMMRRPERIPIFNGYFVEEYSASEIFDASLVMPSVAATMVPFLHVGRTARQEPVIVEPENHHQNCSKWRRTLSKKLSLKRRRPEEMRDDWKYVAMVIDRLLLLLFFGVTLGGTLGIICSAPHVFDFVDQEKVIWLAGKKRASAERTSAVTLGWAALALCSFDEDRLVTDLFNGYNSLIRPVPNASSPPIEVAFSLALVLLINIDEKNQIMHTNVWPTMRWKDYQMQWDPRFYGNIETIRVPPDKVWLPDIVLFNNADGNYLVSFYSNVVVEHTGEMLWVPPAVYKSSCIIDVEYFPFDEQVCALTFGSWTFKKEEVQISYLMGRKQVELNDYSFSGIWDVMEVPGLLIEDRSKISYQIRIRRKTLFYTVILILPTVLMAFLSMMVFYLPCEASEKITLAISILLALVVFLLLVSKILPPTSSTIPLMAKYLLMTFVMNMITIMVTVVIINVYFRGPATHTMPQWVRTLFLTLELKRAREERRQRRGLRGVLQAIRGGQTSRSNGSGEDEVPEIRAADNSGLSKEATQAIDAIEYITCHLTRDNDYKRQCDEWKFVSMVLDRLLLYIFFAATTGGTLGVLLSAPNVFEYVDQGAVIQSLKLAAAAEHGASS
ncbi:unnamed protein product [Heligmosomoides polygyrus]|uniref:Acetylcholine receptor subunit beta-type unc-29 n=1 Tax=Heligmosomoides polygyrus TaxID=6339 RepID=A0A3P8BS90_HELPZ|nr:unnamed protein product [Heligmosomoides polygyrus]